MLIVIYDYSINVYFPILHRNLSVSPFPRHEIKCVLISSERQLQHLPPPGIVPQNIQAVSTSALRKVTQSNICLHISIQYCSFALEIATKCFSKHMTLDTLKTEKCPNKTANKKAKHTCSCTSH